MKSKFLLIPIILIIVSCREKTGYELFIRMNKAIQEIERVEYIAKNKLEHKKSFFIAEDYGQCYFDFTKMDSLFGPVYHFISLNEERKRVHESFFNGKELVFINWEDSTVTKSLPTDPEIFKLNVRSRILFNPSIAFLHEVLPQLIEEEILHEENCVVEKLKLNGKKYYKITANLKNINFWYSFIIDATNEKAFPTLECIIDSRTFLPVKISVHWEDWTDYEITQITNLVINGPARADSILDADLLPGYIKRIDPFKQLDVLEPGTEAPDFRLGGLLNDTIQLNNLRGKVVLLNFWSVGCGPCVMSIPFLNSLLEKYPSDRFELVGINTPKRSIEILHQYAKSTNMNFNNYLGDAKTREDYKIWGVPAFYILNRAGKIEYVAMGYNENIGESIRYYLDSLILGK